MKILVAIPDGSQRDSFFSDNEIKKIEALGEVIWNNKTEQFTPEELHDMLIDKDVVVTGWGCTRLTKDVISNADKLKLLVHVGGTVAAVASPELYEKGVKVISGNKLFAISVAEGVVAYILAALRRIPFFSTNLANGKWMGLSYPDIVNNGLFGKTIGIVSFGAISKVLVKLLAPFGVKTLVYSRNLSDDIAKEYNITKVSLEDLFSKSDIITVQTALNEHTYHMIDENLLSKIKEGALFVNTARGPVVDEEALVKLLKQNRFSAVLDVYSSEPLDENHMYRGLDNVMLMPHTAGPTMDFRRLITDELINDISRFSNGQALECEIFAQNAFSMSSK